MQFHGKREERGWCVIGQPLGWKDGDDKKKLESHYIDEGLITLIAKTPQNQDLHIEIVCKQTSDSDNDSTDSDSTKEEEEEAGNDKESGDAAKGKNKK